MGLRGRGAARGRGVRHCGGWPRARPRGPGGVPRRARAHHRGMDAPVPARPRRLAAGVRRSGRAGPGTSWTSASVDESACWVGARVGEERLELEGLGLAELDAPLVERVDAPDRRPR